ncbi:MAG: class I SAM-dependent methyltransferase [Clostridiales bacterium]
MKAYDNLAPYYDEFMDFMEYDDEAKRIHSFLCEIGAKDVLDLGAGSGGHLIPLLRNGHTVDALDISAPMLKVLEGKLQYQGLKTHLFEGDMCNFHGGKPYDVIYAFGDTIHHLENDGDFEAFLTQSYDNLKSGGYLIFTWRRPDYFQEMAELEKFYEDHGDDYLLWNVSYNGLKNAKMDYTAFILQSDGKFNKIEETHNLRVYKKGEVAKLSADAGFTTKQKMVKEFLAGENDTEEFRIITLLQKP